jgi:hypothetical protein
MCLQQLSEVRFAQPAIDPRADLDAYGARHVRRTPKSPGEVDLPETALAQKALNPILKICFGAADDL